MPVKTKKGTPFIPRFLLGVVHQLYCYQARRSLYNISLVRAGSADGLADALRPPIAPWRQLRERGRKVEEQVAEVVVVVGGLAAGGGIKRSGEWE